MIGLLVALLLQTIDAETAEKTAEKPAASSSAAPAPKPPDLTSARASVSSALAKSGA